MEVPAKLRSALAGFRYWLVALIFMATSTFLVACGGGGSTTVISQTTTTTVPVVADTLTIINSPTSVFANGSITITAYAKNGGSAVIGEMITFEITDNNSSSEVNGQQIITVPTGGSGRASVTFTAGPTSGVTDEITVTSTTELVTHNVTVNPRPASSVVVSSSIDTLDADGVDRTQIQALVKDANGIVIIGQNIAFTTTAGAICAAPAPGPLPGDCGAAQPLTALTDSDGIARITLQSSTNLEKATVKATAPNSTSGSTDVFFIAGPAANIILQANPANLTADGSSTSIVTALVRDANNHIVADGVTVTFSRVAATSVGTGAFPLNPEADTVGGLASQTFTAGTTPGAVDILATAGTATSGTSGDDLITLIQETVGSIVVTPDASTLIADGLDFMGVDATVYNSDGDLVNDGTAVTFATLPSGGNGGDLGIFADLPITPVVDTFNATTIGGVATVFLQASKVAGSYSVKATAGSKSHVAPVEFLPGPAVDGNSALTVNPGTIEANAIATAVLTLTAEDVNNNPVADGTSVTFTTSAGVFTSTLTTTATATTTGGIATAVIRSSATPTVTVNLGAFLGDGSGLTETATMTFGDNNSINPNSIQLTLSGGRDGDGQYIVVESPGGSTPALITATVRDGFGNLIPNCTNNIEFDIISGPADAELDGAVPATPVVKSTASGVASVSLSAGAISGTVRVKAEVVLESDCSSGMSLSAITTPIVIASGPAANVFIYANPNVVDNNDSTTSQIMNAIVTDSYGNPVEDGTAVFFFLSAPGPANGESVCANVYTGGVPVSACVGATTSAKGVARTKLTWPATSIWGSFTLTAQTQGAADATYSGTYPAVAPIHIDVTFNPASPAPSVYSAIEVWAYMTDGSTPFANDIEGVSLNFTSNNPAVTFPGVTSDTTGADGRATVDVDALNCSSSAVIATITASAGSFSGSAPLTVSANDQVANFTSADGGGAGSFIVNFFDASTPQTGGGATTTYSWNFGDGTFGAGANPSHTYASAGPWSVTLTTTMATTGCFKTSATQPVTAP